jgi:putative ABC transport system permease protein
VRLSTIALRNVRRHLSRSALMVLVIAAAVAVVTTLYLTARSAETDLANKTDEFGANIVVAPRTQELPLVYGGVQLGGLTYDVQSLDQIDVLRIRDVADGMSINKVSPNLVGLANVAGKTVLVDGVQWDQQLGLKKWWRLRGTVPTLRNEVVLGSTVAARLQLQPGGAFETGKHYAFTVASVLEPTGTQDDDVIFMYRDTAGRMLGRQGQVSFIELSAWCAGCPIDRLTAQISAALPNARVSSVLKSFEARRILIGQFQLFSIVLSGLMVLVGCLIVLTSTLGSVRDRRSEIGIFRALGYRRRHVFNIILLENMALALVAGVVGIILAIVVAEPLARTVAEVRQTVAPAPLHMALALVASLVVVAAASLYPAGKAAGQSPTLAMRRL